MVNPESQSKQMQIRYTLTCCRIQMNDVEYCEAKDLEVTQSIAKGIYSTPRNKYENRSCKTKR